MQTGGRLEGVGKIRVRPSLKNVLAYNETERRTVGERGAKSGGEPRKTKGLFLARSFFNAIVHETSAYI